MSDIVAGEFHPCLFAPHLRGAVPHPKRGDLVPRTPEIGGVRRGGDRVVKGGGHQPKFIQIRVLTAVETTADTVCRERHAEVRRSGIGAHRGREFPLPLRGDRAAVDFLSADSGYGDLRPTGGALVLLPAPFKPAFTTFHVVSPDFQDFFDSF